MFDIKFDITNREVFMLNGDFVATSNPSVQNGGILLYGRCIDPINPTVGIGIEEGINANGNKMAFELNRWQSMAIADGATIAKWTASNNGNDADILTDISYL